ncbi:MAG TPA: response regulator [Vineibacter sp.]|nr:response regulator [Vineibacter sp.]
MADSIYIVDDDDAVRESLRALMEAHGFTVHDFTSGTAFLDCHEHTMRGCLLLDVNLPGTDGFAVLQLLVAAGSSLSVIMMSARTDGATDAVAAGAFGFVQKPFKAGELIAMVALALTDGRREA